MYVSDRITLARFSGKGPQLFDRAATIEKLGLPPEQVIDYKALCGDSSDNYKGINGMGPKGASKLLHEHQDIEGIFAHLETLPPVLQAKFKEQSDYLHHCRHLATIKTDVPLEISFNDIENYQLPTTQVTDFYKELGFNRLLQRLGNLSSNSDHSKSKEQNNYSEKTDQNKQLNLF